MTNNEKVFARALATNIYNGVKNTINKFRPHDAILNEAIDELFEENFGVYTSRKDLRALSWGEIAEISESGDAEKCFRIGDTKTITLYTGEKIDVAILGFGHDFIFRNENLTGDVAGITFSMSGVLDGKYEMQEDDPQVGGWKKSKMRTVYMPRLFSLLPDALKTAIKPVSKLTGAGCLSNKTEMTEDKLFLLAQIEVTGRSEYVAEGEGFQYPYFQTADSDVIFGTCKSKSWWLRSPSATECGKTRCVQEDGSIVQRFDICSRGVSFCFCI